MNLFMAFLVVLIFGVTYPICAASAWTLVKQQCTQLGLEPRKYCGAVVGSYGFVYLLMFAGAFQGAFAAPTDITANMLTGGMVTAAAMISLIMLGLTSAFRNLAQEAARLKQDEAARATVNISDTASGTADQASPK